MVRSSDGEEQRSGLLETLVIVAIVLVLAAITAALMSPLEKQQAKDCGREAEGWEALR